MFKIMKLPELFKSLHFDLNPSNSLPKPNPPIKGNGVFFLSGISSIYFEEDYFPKKAQVRQPKVSLTLGNIELFEETEGNGP